MGLTTLINRSATIIRRGASVAEDAYGNEIPQETASQILVELQQRQRDEPDRQGELSDTDWVAFFLPGTDIATGDAIVVDGAEYELVGEPWHARNPRTQAPSHIEVSLRRTRGALDEGGS